MEVIESGRFAVVQRCSLAAVFAGHNAGTVFVHIAQK
jgi:hypothetical protein